MKKIMKKIDNYIVILLFAGFLLGFAVWGLAAEDRYFSPNENRVLQQLPELSADSVISGDFSEDFQRWQDDQFPLRDRWITLRTALRLASGGRDINGVYFGKDSYLIEKLTPEVMDRQQFEKNLQAVRDFRNRLPSSVNLSVMAVPTTGSVMRDKLPRDAAVFDEDSFASEAAKKLAGCGWVDLYESFRKAAGEGQQLYYRTDHHWTTPAAEMAFTSWKPDVKLTSDRHPLTEEFLGSQYSKVLWGSGHADTVEGYGTGAAEVTADGQRLDGGIYQERFLKEKDKYAVFLGGNYGRVEIEGSGKDGRLLIVKDSFANCFAPYAAEAYERVCMVDLRYFSGSLDEYAEENGITEVLVLCSMENLINDKNLAALSSRGRIL